MKLLKLLPPHRPLGHHEKRQPECKMFAGWLVAAVVVLVSLGHEQHVQALRAGSLHRYRCNAGERQKTLQNAPFGQLVRFLHEPVKLFSNLQLGQLGKCVLAC